MKKLIILLLTVLCISGCSADPEAKTAKEWVREALIEDYVGDDEVVFRFEDDYQVYLGGENYGNYFKWENECDNFAIMSIEVIILDGEIIKKYYAFIRWEDDGNLFNLFTKPENRKISDEFLIDLDIIEEE